MKTTRDGFPMTAEVWEIEGGWTWGWVPAPGSRYQAVGKGIWRSEDSAMEAMNIEKAAMEAVAR